MGTLSNKLTISHPALLIMSHPPHATLGQSSYPRLTRSLSAVESWGFGLTAHISWTALVPAIHAALGSQAIFVWIPAVIFGMLLNYQVKRLGMHFMNVAGGTPNYATGALAAARSPGSFIPSHISGHSGVRSCGASGGRTCLGLAQLANWAIISHWCHGN
ncbi:hypothetical protein [Nostoc commune]|uniref:hypothetical protein n=1 Tax=Nostoc commune TaxID=1178 RepID=UPI001E296A44|nr:hypothetical protein [Nostoc commune]